MNPITRACARTLDAGRRVTVRTSLVATAALVVGFVAWSGGARAASSCPTSSPYSTQVAGTSGLVGYWRLDDPSGTAACDETSKDPGTYQGGLTLGTSGAIVGDADKAASFDGSSADVSVPSATSLNTGDVFSFEAWVKRVSTGTAQVIGTKQGSSWTLSFNTSNQLTLQTGTKTIATSTSAITDTSGWHQVAVTKNGTAVHLYIDGKDVTGTVSNRTLSNSTSALLLGSASGSSYFKGTLDETALYNVALSANQVTNHYLLGLAYCPATSSSYAKTVAGTSGLLGYWRLGERSGTTACDSVGKDPGSYLGTFTLGQGGAVNGDSDSAALFDGASGWVSVPALSSLDAGDTFSFEAWVKRGSTGTNQVVASKQGSAWTVAINASDKLALQSGSTTIAASTSTITDTSGWHQVAVTKSGSAVHLYIDGADVTGTVTNVTLANSTSPLAIGQSGASGSYFKGTIDEVALYNVALTASQVQSHYTLGAAPANTALPSISGTTTDGQTLTASNGSWAGASSYGYQWQDCDSAGNNCQNIAAATQSTYTLGHGDVGHTIRVVVTASNSAGQTPASSSQTQTVAATPPSNTAAPSVSGTTTDGQTLTAANGTWSGTPGSYSYQWQQCDPGGANCQDITGATASTYTL